ncbi:MAG: thioredoxin domain-containing protein [bacterium]|nr:thioredoxin domain-containing protein [bacterium]
MLKNSVLLFLVALLLISCSGQTQTNDLVNETSAYLKLHAKNPVDWKPWGDKALAQAQKEDKLVIISIGYVSCHWCHVMEEEAFSDEQIALKMNENFVSIKVDREERPDVDKTYMNASYIINGSGGWPLNIIALPDGRPVYAATYLPPNKWDEMLDFFVNMKTESPEKLETQARSLQTGLTAIEANQFAESKLPLETILNDAITNLKETADPVWGGRKGAPKFPIPVLLEFQLQEAYLKKDSILLNHVLLTLDKIIEGGIYDHLAGGFFRYSTDEYWRVPHFEKMLYDNGQLVQLYSNAYKLTGKESYKKAIIQTLKFMEEDMTLDNGLFYASIDADSEGEEGKFYIWENFDGASLENQKLTESHFGIDLTRELDGQHVLYLKKSRDQLAKKNNIPIQELDEILDSDIQKLKSYRSGRIEPYHDEKVITSWNTLMALGYLYAYEALGDEAYFNKAEVAISQLVELVVNENRVAHLLDGEQGYLEDAVFLTSALIKLYENTYEIEHLNLAREISIQAMSEYEDSGSEFYFYSSPKNGSLVVNVHEITDNVVPGSNSQMAINLYQLGHYFYDTALINKSERLLKYRLQDLQENPYANANWGILASWIENGLYEIATTGPDCMKFRDEMSRTYIPNAIFLGHENEEPLLLLENKVSENRSLIYVCRDKTCKFPVDRPEMALSQMDLN